MNFVRVLFFLLITSGGHVFATDKPGDILTNQKLVYRVKLSGHSLLRASVTVDTSKIGSFVLLSPRQKTNVPEKYEPLVKCFNSSSGNKRIFYGEKSSCDKISWNIDFEILNDSDFLADQRSIYSENGWWLLSEWGSFPRFKSINDAAVCIQLKGEELCQRLPDKKEPPMMFVWGSGVSFKADKLSVNVYSDNDRVMNIGPDIIDKLSTQINYLSRVFSKSNNMQHLPGLNSFNLVLVGSDRKNKTISGVAGYQTIVSNYIVDNGKLDESSFAMMLKVVGHESVHVISKTSFPLWVGESLAEYYGYQSLKAAGVAFNSPMDEWKKVRKRFPQTGLYEAYTQVLKKKNYSYYPLFYLKGAVFWQAVDEALKQHGQSLDEYIYLLSGEYYTLPVFFSEVIEKIISADTWKKIEKEYLL